MNSFPVLRLWQFQTRLPTAIPTSARWRPDRRKRRGQWTCAACRASASAGGSQQRFYADGVSVSPLGHILSPAPPLREDGDVRAKASGQQGSDAAARSAGGSVRAGAGDALRESACARREGDGEKARSFAGQESRPRARRADRRKSEGYQDEAKRLEGEAGLRRLVDIDYKSLFPVGLDGRDADLVTRCLLAATQANDREFIQAISASAFLDVLSVVQPANFLGKLRSTHEDLSSHSVALFGVAPVRQVSSEVAEVLQKIVDIRVRASTSLEFMEYKKLLQHARDLGHARFAKTLWHSMGSDGFAPDIDCYNYYMGAVVRDGLNDANLRQRHRVIPFNMAARQTSRLGPNHWNFRVREQGLQFTVMQIFSEALERGLAANVESFQLLVTAAAREGDMETVKSILRNIWGVDVDALMADDAPNSTASTTQMARDSPLYPTPELLFTFAHALGIINNLPAALRVVDHVAQRFEIEIDRDAWGELFNWTFVLSIRRSGVSARTDGTREGALPKQSVLSLWHTMTNPPYSIQPTMQMYSHLLKNLWQRDWPPEMLKYMEQGKSIYVQSRVAAARAFKNLDQAVAGSSVPGIPGPAHLALRVLRREYEDANLVRRKNFANLQRWVRLVLSATTGYIRTPGSDRWAFEDLPRMLWDWAPMAPSRVVYEAPGGIVELHAHSLRAQRRSARAGHREGKRRAAVINAVPRLLGREWFLPNGEARRPRRATERVGISNKRRVRPRRPVSQVEKV